MNYASYDDLAGVIRTNLWKIPSDVDLIVGVPRSGMIAALMMAEYLNKHCTDLKAFIDGHALYEGVRGLNCREGKKGKVLILEDTVNLGCSMDAVRALVERVKDKYEIIYGTVFAEGAHAKSMVDIYLTDNFIPGDEDWFYEWNILHHGKNELCMWDLDGLLCKNPPDDSDLVAYERYIKDPIPMVIPTYPIGVFVTYRLEKYREITEAWLRSQDVRYGRLIMFDAPDREARNRYMCAAAYKAKIYRNNPGFLMFVESDTEQAEQIHVMSGKPVFCFENGKMYK